MKKTAPTRRRDEAGRAATSLGDQLREWLHARQIAAGIRNRKRKKDQNTGKRGVDRVPEHLRGLAPTVKWVHEHTSPSRRLTRASGASRGRLNQPYTNPMRDVKALRSGRLRKELRP